MLKPWDGGIKPQGCSELTLPSHATAQQQKDCWKALEKVGESAKKQGAIVELTTGEKRNVDSKMEIGKRMRMRL